MKVRGLDKDFLAAMREKLEQGRQAGRRGWDTHWDRALPCSLQGTHGSIMRGLREEMAELEVAVVKGKLDEIRSEAADVANFAMMVADIHGALNSQPKKPTP